MSGFVAEWTGPVVPGYRDDIYLVVRLDAHHLRIVHPDGWGHMIDLRHCPLRRVKARHWLPWGVCRCNDRRWDYRALLSILRRQGISDDHEVAEHLTCSFRAAIRYRQRPRLSDQQADRLAVAAGYHPAEVWPDWWEAAMHPRERRRLERAS